MIASTSTDATSMFHSNKNIDDYKENDPDFQPSYLNATTKPSTSIKQKAKILQMVNTNPSWKFKTI